MVEKIRREEAVRDIAGLDNESDDDVEVDRNAKDNTEEEYSMVDQLRFSANAKMTLERH